jgi:DNA-directed RNA polymerase specialized sigma24 family protein
MAAIDKAELSRLCRDVETNREAISLVLYELANKVAASYSRANPDPEFAIDVAHDIWVDLVSKLDKYDPQHGNAFGYFWRIASRKCWKLIHEKVGEQMSSVYDETDEPAGVTGTYQSVEPLRYHPERLGRKGASPAARKLLDTFLVRIRKDVKVNTLDGAAYDYITTGIQFLQLYRARLCGSYFPMQLPSGMWTADRWVPSSPN